MGTSTSRRSSVEAENIGAVIECALQKVDVDDSERVTNVIEKSIKGDNESRYTTGWKLHIISLGLLTAMFLYQMEPSITSTSVLAITDDLGGYGKSSWLFTAYLLT